MIGPAELVICGSGFGGYLGRLLARAPELFRVSGVLGTGSGRSLALANALGVECWSSAQSVPRSCELAVVAVPKTSQQDAALPLLSAGISVLCECPLSTSLLQARVSTRAHIHAHQHLHRLPASRAFLQRFDIARQQHSPLRIVAAASERSLPGMLDLLYRCVGPITLLTRSIRPNLAQAMLEGSGVPISLTWSPRTPDSTGRTDSVQACMLTVAFEAGCLDLGSPMGPVRWTLGYGLAASDIATSVSMQLLDAPDDTAQFARDRALAVVAAVAALRDDHRSGVCREDQSRPRLLQLAQLAESLCAGHHAK